MDGIEYEMLGRLLVNVCRLHATRADQFMEQLHLFRGQAILLMILAHHDGMTHSEIAEKLAISPAAATKVIKRLEQANYLKRQADPDDERVSRVFLQEEGRAVTGHIHRSFERLDRMMFEGIAEPDLEQLRGMLSQMQTNLQSYQPGPEG